MPRRSSRSSPASFTSWSEPTGSASRTAMRRSPVVRLTVPHSNDSVCHPDVWISARQEGSWRDGAARPAVVACAAMGPFRALLRPLRLDTWRELAYLLLGFAMSIVTFVVLVTLLSLGVSLLITLLGVPILLASAYVNRWFADVER